MSGNVEAADGPAQHDERAHRHAQAGEVANNAAVGDEHERRPGLVSVEHRADLGELAVAEGRVTERATEWRPRLGPTEGQACRLHAAAARARQDPAHRDALAPERLTDPPGLRLTA